MRKTIVIIAIVGMILVSFASAGLVGFLSNSVSGTVEVRGPVFYLDKKLPDSDKYYSLKLNEESTTTSKPVLDGDENLWFISDVLGIDNFYDEKYNITLTMVAEGGDSNSTGTIFAELWIGDENNMWKEDDEAICRTPILLGIGRDEYPYSLDCIPKNSDGLKNIEKDEKMMMVLRTAPTDVGVKIYIKSSKIEVLVR
ncbi:hypothetical protein KAS08_02755 [Candidatus Pacearchaeota archaeon]|nr:hypothetical protein [Candidatus Pacearchaeota archaeon]